MGDENRDEQTIAALWHRFTKQKIETMMREAGLTDIVFSDREPFWVACGKKR